MSEFSSTDQSLGMFPELAPLPCPAQNEGIRATRKAAQWRAGLAQSFAYAAGRARGTDAQARAWQAYEEEEARGPDFTRYHGGSEFREAPKITADRNALARIRFKLIGIANGSWATKEKGKHAGLVQRTAIAVFDALCSLAKKHGRVFPSHVGIAYLAKCSKNTVIAALKQLEFFGFITVHRRVKRIKTDLGFRTVQDTNAYMVKEPNTWGEKALALFARVVGAVSESKRWPARNSNLSNQRSKGADLALSRPSGGGWEGLYEEWGVT